MRPSIIISGMQSGADQGCLRAARTLGIATGGYAPKGYLTEGGPDPAFGKEFGLLEHWSQHDYAPRTEANVKLGDATVIFGRRSVGSNLTERLCQQHRKPFIWITDPAKPGEMLRFKLWLARHQPEVLNGAGNRESVTPGIGALVEAFLVKALRSS